MIKEVVANGIKTSKFRNEDHMASVEIKEDTHLS